MTSFSQTSVQPIARRALISGKVQGVGYRFALAAIARELNIMGWCRNLADGRVEAWLQGEPAAVEKVLDWLHQGPPQAVVENVEVENQAMLEPLLQENIQTFEIRK
jgi:acylphosphatase